MTTHQDRRSRNTFTAGFAVAAACLLALLAGGRAADVCTAPQTRFVGQRCTGPDQCYAGSICYMGTCTDVSYGVKAMLGSVCLPHGAPGQCNQWYTYMPDESTGPYVYVDYGLVCSNATQRCVPKRRAGEPCEATIQCMEGTCGADGRCAAQSTAGAACGGPAGLGCAPGMLCAAGVCKTMLGDGAKVSDASTQACASQRADAQGVCAALPASKQHNETCADSPSCAPGLRCQQGACVPALPDGSAGCASDDDCVPDSFCSAQGACTRGSAVACSSTADYAGCNCASGGGAPGVRAAATAPAALTAYPQLTTAGCAKYRAAYESCDKMHC